jgi:hypothetical protein
VALYYGYGSDASLKATLDAFKACMTDIKRGIEMDFSRLSGALESAAPTTPGVVTGVEPKTGEPALREVW